MRIQTPIRMKYAYGAESSGICVKFMPYQPAIRESGKRSSRRPSESASYRSDAGRSAPAASRGSAGRTPAASGCGRTNGPRGFQGAKTDGRIPGKKVIFVLGEYFAHVEKLLVIGMEHEQLPTDRDQGPLQLFGRVSRRDSRLSRGASQNSADRAYPPGSAIPETRKQVEDIGSIERFFREEEALQSRKCLFVGCQNKLPRSR